MASLQEWHATQPYTASKCSLGEGPYYVKERNELRYLDINNHKLFIINLTQGADSIKTIDTGMPVGVTADLEGVDSSEIIICGAKDGVTKFNLLSETHEYVVKYWSGVDAAEKTKRMRSNDGAVDSAGRLWVEAFVDPSIAEVTEEGILFLLNHDGSLSTKFEGARIPNGISWSLKDDEMFFTESPSQTVYVFDFDSKTGSIDNKRVFFRLDEDGVFPDGHAMDVDGNIWHACYGGSKVIRISPQGKVTGIIHLPTRNITCCVFAGTDLFITSAIESEPDKFPDSARFGGNLFCINVGIEGVQKHKVKLSV